MLVVLWQLMLLQRLLSHKTQKLLFLANEYVYHSTVITFTSRVQILKQDPNAGYSLVTILSAEVNFGHFWSLEQHANGCI